MKSLIAISILLVNIIIVYFGRMYFPINFSPNQVSFYENYSVLTLVECFTIFIGFCFYLLLKFIYNDVKNFITEHKH